MESLPSEAQHTAGCLRQGLCCYFPPPPPLPRTTPCGLVLFACDSPTCRSKDASPWRPPTVLYHVSLPQGPSLLPGSFKSSVEPKSLTSPGIPCPVSLTGEGRCLFSFPRDSLTPDSRSMAHGLCPLGPTLLHRGPLALISERLGVFTNSSDNPAISSITSTPFLSGFMAHLDIGWRLTDPVPYACKTHNPLPPESWSPGPCLAVAFDDYTDSTHFSQQSHFKGEAPRWKFLSWVHGW